MRYRLAISSKLADMSTPAVQQSVGDKAFFKAQTLSYLNGYQREEPNPIVRDLAPETQTLSGTQLTGTVNSPSRATGSPTKLPQWVENDRKVHSVCMTWSVTDLRLPCFPRCFIPPRCCVRSCASMATSKNPSLRAASRTIVFAS